MIIFGIMEKKKDDILYEGEFIPSKSRLIEFKKILEKIQNKSKGVVNCEEALKRLDNIIGNNTESRIDAKIIVDQKAKNYQNRTVGLVENGTWAPNAAKCMKEILEGMKDITIIEPIISIKTTMNEENKNQMKQLVEKML